jgi:FMN reductase
VIDVVAVVGNPRPGGRTTRVAQAVAARVAALGSGEVETIELADHAARMFDPSDPGLGEVAARVAGADVAVLASPTYKASFTGLLKAFLDRYTGDGLAGVVAVPVMLGGSPTHSLAPDTQLRPVLVELGAVVPTRSVYVVDTEMDRLEETLDRWWSGAEAVLRRMLG